MATSDSLPSESTMFPSCRNDRSLFHGFASPLAFGRPPADRCSGERAGARIPPGHTRFYSPSGGECLHGTTRRGSRQALLTPAHAASITANAGSGLPTDGEYGTSAGDASHDTDTIVGRPDCGARQTGRNGVGAASRAGGQRRHQDGGRTDPGSPCARSCGGARAPPTAWSRSPRAASPCESTRRTTRWTPARLAGLPDAPLGSWRSRCRRRRRACVRRCETSRTQRLPSFSTMTEEPIRPCDVWKNCRAVGRNVSENSRGSFADGQACLRIISVKRAAGVSAEPAAKRRAALRACVCRSGDHPGVDAVLQGPAGVTEGNTKVGVPA